MANFTICGVVDENDFVMEFETKMKEKSGHQNTHTHLLYTRI